MEGPCRFAIEADAPAAHFSIRVASATLIDPGVNRASSAAPIRRTQASMPGPSGRAISRLAYGHHDLQNLVDPRICCLRDIEAQEAGGAARDAEDVPWRQHDIFH